MKNRGSPPLWRAFLVWNRVLPPRSTSTSFGSSQNFRAFWSMAAVPGGTDLIPSDKLIFQTEPQVVGCHPTVTARNPAEMSASLSPLKDIIIDTGVLGPIAVKGAPEREAEIRDLATQAALYISRAKLREIHKSGRRDLPARVPTGFLSPPWRKLRADGGAPDRRAYEVAVMVISGTGAAPVTSGWRVACRAQSWCWYRQSSLGCVCPKSCFVLMREFARFGSMGAGNCGIWIMALALNASPRLIRSMA